MAEWDAKNPPITIPPEVEKEYDDDFDFEAPIPPPRPAAPS